MLIENRQLEPTPPHVYLAPRMG